MSDTIPARLRAQFASHRLASLVGLLLVAAAVRFACVRGLHEVPYGDYAAYYLMASNLYSGHGLIDSFGNLAYMNAGYPLFLYVLFHLTGVSVRAATYANAALGTISVLLVYLLGRAVFERRFVAFLGAALWACYLPAITYCEHLAKEDLMAPLLLAQLLLTVHYLRSRPSAWLAIGMGMVIAAQALVGSSALVLVPLSVVALASGGDRPWRLKARHALLASVTATVLLAPWLYRNDVVLGSPVLNTNGGFNLYLGNNPAATGMFESVAKTPLGKLWQGLRARMGEVRANTRLEHAALAYMAQHPLATARLDVKKLGLFWEPPVHEGVDHNAERGEALARAIWLVQYLILGAFALAGLFTLWRVPGAWVLLGAVALYTALHMLFFVQFRYRLPIMPVVALIAAYGMQHAYLRYGNRYRRFVPAVFRIMSKQAG